MVYLVVNDPNRAGRAVFGQGGLELPSYSGQACVSCVARRACRHTREVGVTCMSRSDTDRIATSRVPASMLTRRCSERVERCGDTRAGNERLFGSGQQHPAFCHLKVRRDAPQPMRHHSGTHFVIPKCPE
jgi:hypothetical protein